MEMKEHGGKLAPALRADGSKHKDEDGTNYTGRKKGLKKQQQKTALGR